MRILAAGRYLVSYKVKDVAVSLAFGRWNKCVSSVLILILLAHFLVSIKKRDKKHFGLYLGQAISRYSSRMDSGGGGGIIFLFRRKTSEYLIVMKQQSKK